MGEEESKLLKIILLGDSSVGKSCLLLRYTESQFTNSTLATIGVDFKSKNINIDGQNVKLQIWDTAGAEKFRSISKSYYRGSNGVLVLFDLSQRYTFDQVHKWIESIREETDSIPVVLIGSKCDLDCKVTKKEAEEMAIKYNIKYFETSAKENINVDESFQCIAKEALQQSMNININPKSQDIAKTDTKSKSWRC